MPSMPMPQSVLDILARPNPCVMATVAPDGHPVSVATWYLLEDSPRVSTHVTIEHWHGWDNGKPMR